MSYIRFGSLIMAVFKEITIPCLCRIIPIPVDLDASFMILIYCNGQLFLTSIEFGSTNDRDDRDGHCRSRTKRHWHTDIARVS